MAPSGLLVAVASFAAFRGLHRGLQLLPAPGAAAEDRWKWRNICVSLMHSLLTGPGALLGCGASRSRRSLGEGEGWRASGPRPGGTLKRGAKPGESEAGRGGRARVPHGWIRSA